MSVHRLVARLVVVAATACLLLACRPPADPPSGGGAGPATAPAVRVEATLAGPRGDDVPLYDIEVLRTATGVRATVDTPRGRFAEEIEVGDRYFVRVPDAAMTLGTDDWIVIDRSRPEEAALALAVRPGMLPLADVDDLEVGDQVFNATIRSVTRTGSRWIIDFGAPADLVVTRTELDEVPPLTVPDDHSSVPIAVLRQRVAAG